MDEGFDRNLSHRCPWKQSASASFGLSCQTVRKLGLYEVSGVWRQDLSVRHERSHSPSLAFIQPVARDAPKWVFISTHISELASLLRLVTVFSDTEDGNVLDQREIHVHPLHRFLQFARAACSKTVIHCRMGSPRSRVREPGRC